MHARPCNGSTAAQEGWSLRPVASPPLSTWSGGQQQVYRIIISADNNSRNTTTTTSAPAGSPSPSPSLSASASALQPTLKSVCVDFIGPDGHPEFAGAIVPCVEGAPGQLFHYNDNHTLTVASDGRCVDVGGGVGPVISAGTCNGGTNQQFTFDADNGGRWYSSYDAGGTGGGTTRVLTGAASRRGVVWPRRCMERRSGSPRPDDASDIYSQVWAKPLPPRGSMAVLVVNNQAGAQFRQHLDFSEIDGLDRAGRYAVRDLYQHTNLGVASAGEWETDEMGEHDSSMYLFTPEGT